MIAIADYGSGNIKSVYKALKHIDCEAVITQNADEILKADALILPGVGSFGDAVTNIENFKIKKTLIDFCNSGKPFLGICLGLQLLFKESEESFGFNGFNLFDEKIKKIPSINNLKIPHMGWNSVKFKNNSPIFEELNDDTYFYFVHSYYLNAQNNENIVTSTAEYGVTIDASIQYKNVFATQFHPEKSGDAGIKVLKNFVNLIK